MKNIYFLLNLKVIYTKQPPTSTYKIICKKNKSRILMLDNVITFI